MSVPMIGERKPKLSVAMVTHDMVPSMTMYDLASLCAFTVAAIPEEVDFGINFVSGTYVHSGRQEMIEGLLAQGVTHMLWIDADMRFPRDAFARLLGHGKDVVGINYAKRGVPTDFVAMKTVDWAAGTSAPLETNADSTGLEKVDAVGFGMVLMKLDALAALPSPEKGPWFWFEWISPGRQVGEDVYFCKLLKEAGIDVWVDHDLSKQCAHIGQFEFRTDHAEAQRALEAESVEEEAAE